MPSLPEVIVSTFDYSLRSIVRAFLPLFVTATSNAASLQASVFSGAVFNAREISSGWQGSSGAGAASSVSVGVPAGLGSDSSELPNTREMKNPAATKTDRKSTRLNSSHVAISYAAFCLKRKKHITSQIHAH